MNQARVAVVTGGGQGIGRSVVRSLAARGDAVVVAGRTRDKLEAVVGEVVAAGGDAHPVAVDVRSAASVAELFAETREWRGEVDVLVTCAVQSRVAGFLDLTDDDWVAHYETKVLGAVRCLREVLPAMAQRRWGRIVNLAGTTARSPGRGRATNGMTNAAIANVGKHLADEFGDRDVLVNTVHPGFTETPRLDMIVERRAELEGTSRDEARARLSEEIPTRRFVGPDEVADLVAFLCSEHNRSITGQSIAVDGGLARAVDY